MTQEFATIRAVRRAREERRRRERAWQAAKAAVVVLFMLLAFGLAGMTDYGVTDYEDRVHDLGGVVEAGW